MRRTIPPSKRSAKSASSPPAATPASSRGSRKGVVFAGLFLLVAITVLSYRVYHTMVVERPPDRLHLDENVPLSSPPSLPEDDRTTLSTGLQQAASLQDAIRVMPGDARAKITYARQAILAGDLYSARKVLQPLVRTLPQGSVPLSDLLGRCEIELAAYVDALQTYETALKRFPDNAVLHVGVSRALTGLGRRSEVVKPLLEGVAALKPDDIGGRMYLAAEFDTLRDTKRGLDLIEAANAVQPGNEAVSIMRASLLHKIGKDTEAKHILEQIVAANKRNAGARRILAQLLDNPNDPHRDRQLAEHYYLEALQISPTDADASWRLGQLCQEEKRYKQAVYLYTLLLQSVPDSAAGRKQLAAVYAKLGKTAESTEQDRLAQQLLSRNSEEADLVSRRDRQSREVAPRLALARHYKHYGQFKKALAELQAGFTLSPQSAEVKSELFSLYGALRVPIPDYLTAK